MSKQMKPAQPAKRSKSSRQPRKVTKAARPARYMASAGIVIRRREFVFEVTSATTYDSWDFNLNPGNQELFPLLFRDSLNHAKYVFESVRLEYVSRSGNVSSTGALGSVSMACNPDVVQPAYGSVASLMSVEGSATESPNKDFSIRVPPDTIKGERYVAYSDTLPSGVDPHTYHCGKIQVMVEGQVANSQVLGQVFIEYVVRLIGYKQPPVGALTSCVEITTDGHAGTTSMATHILGNQSFYGGGIDKDQISVVTLTTGESAVEFRDPGRYLVMVSGSNQTADPSALVFNWSPGVAPVKVPIAGVLGYLNYCTVGEPLATPSGSFGTVMVESTVKFGWVSAVRHLAWTAANAVCKWIVIALPNYGAGTTFPADAYSSGVTMAPRVATSQLRDRRLYDPSSPSSSSSSATGTVFPPPPVLRRDPPLEPIQEREESPGDDDAEIQAVLAELKARKASKK